MSEESEDLDPMDFEDFKRILFENDPETKNYYQLILKNRLN